MLSNLIQNWDKKYLLLVMAAICLLLYFFGSQSIPEPATNWLRPIGYCCLGLGGILNLATQSNHA